MFVLDNDVVRTGWEGAKAHVTDLIAKHGGTVTTARHWGERKLAYSMKGRSRATYLLTYYEIPAGNIPTLIRDLDLSETVLRYLTLAVDAIPEGEVEAAGKETASDFMVPEPPRDEVGEFKLWDDKEEDATRRAPRREAPASDASNEAASAEPETVAAATDGGEKPTEEN
jgi:small subunit ribosomal protein S6